MDTSSDRTEADSSSERLERTRTCPPNSDLGVSTRNWFIQDYLISSGHASLNFQNAPRLVQLLQQSIKIKDDLPPSLTDFKVPRLRRKGNE